MKTWEDIERAALHEPVLQQALTYVRRGDLSQRDALIAAVLALVEIKNAQQRELIDWIKRCPASPITVATS